MLASSQSVGCRFGSEHDFKNACQHKKCISYFVQESGPSGMKESKIKL